MEITLTKNQLFFLKCAIEGRSAVLPLDTEVLSPEIFEDDYGVSQDEMNREIDDLLLQLQTKNSL